MTTPSGASVSDAMHRARAHPTCPCAVCKPGPRVAPGVRNSRLAETLGDYRNVAAAPEGEDAALDDLAEVVCATGGHIPPRDRDREACDFHRRTAAGYLRVVRAAR